MKRRNFLKSSVVTTSAFAATACTTAATAAGVPKQQKAIFQLKYAPHLGMFKHSAGEDPIDQLNFMADQGFKAFEDNNMKGRSIEVDSF